ncbi:methylesterase 2-like [Cucurbita moschata]|uniref:Methylesterase 2-like n=1 Tax=Cucurbita moschata TaxID=3662 RepID=A0A6J1EU76_CUCMO|nr:methylesterase 2-like [Cucurbita moschata]
MQKLLLSFLVLILVLFSSPTRSSDQSESTYSHFVLVHGACLGAWSWYKVITLLQTAGHKVTALDMAAAGINQTQPESLASLTEYFEPLLSFMEALPSDERIVLVGHSLGGLGISMAMESFPEKVSVAIFVTAAMPGPIVGSFTIEELMKILEMLRAFYSEEDSKASDSNLFLFSQEELKTKLFPLSPPQDVALATTLERPQAMFGILESMKELRLTRDKYGSVKRAFIISEKDEMTSKIMVWAMLTFNKPDRQAEVKGSDHMVMASKPLELAQQLTTIAQDFASSSTYHM